MENKGVKIWYKKKRFMIPAATLGIISISSAFSGDYDTSEPVKEVPSYVVPISTETETKTTNTIKTTPTTPKTTPVQTSAPKTSNNCNTNYSGCLNPNASDYDCAGGSGDGPYYTGQVAVIGYDEYGLDRDGDGIGCE